VMTRTGNIDVRRLYIGPKNVDPEDMVGLMSAVVAASINTAFLNPEDRKNAKALFLEQVSERIETAREEHVEERKSTVGD
jgi:DNA-binding protein YbaB